MDIVEYVHHAVKTECTYDRALEMLRDPSLVRILHAAMNLCDEAGELQKELRNHIFYGKPLDKVNLLREEPGDLFWALAVLMHELEEQSHFDVADVLEANIQKLRVRFPGGFSEEHSANRDLKRERRALTEKRQPATEEPRAEYVIQLKSKEGWYDWMLESNPERTLKKVDELKSQYPNDDWRALIRTQQRLIWEDLGESAP